MSTTLPVHTQRTQNSHQRQKYTVSTPDDRILKLSILASIVYAVRSSMLVPIECEMQTPVPLTIAQLFPHLCSVSSATYSWLIPLPSPNTSSSFSSKATNKLPLLICSGPNSPQTTQKPQWLDSLQLAIQRN